MPVCFDDVFRIIKTGNLANLKEFFNSNKTCFTLRNDNGQSALHLATLYGYQDVVEWLIVNIRLSLIEKDNNDQSLFHFAVLSGNQELVSWFVKLCDERAADESTDDAQGKKLTLCLSDVTKDQKSILHYASDTRLKIKNQLEMFRFLLQLLQERQILKELAKREDIFGWTALHYIALSGEVEFLKYWCFKYKLSIHAKTKVKLVDSDLTRKNGQQHILHIAAMQGDVPLFEHVLFSDRLSLVDADALGNTPAHIAARHGQVTLLSRCIEWLDNLKTTNRFGRTVLLEACRFGQAVLVEFLLKQHGHSLIAKDKQGNTALLCAAIGGSKETMVLLLNYGADRTARDSLGRNILLHIIEHGHIHLIEWVTETREKGGLGLAVSVTDSRNNNALHYVINSLMIELSRKEAVSKFLLKKDPSLKNGRGSWWRKPLDQAKRQRALHMVALLRQKQPSAFDPPQVLAKFQGIGADNGSLIDCSQLRVSNLLGEGCYGQVFLGEWNVDSDRGSGGAIEVAVKQLCVQSLEENAAKVKQEFLAMTALTHSNIVRLYGCSVDAVGQRYNLILEHMALGPLNLFLRNSHNDIDAVLSCQIACDISAGLAYLHGREIIHRDLKSSSILLNGLWHAKISNFNMAKIRGMTTVHQTATGKSTAIFVGAPYKAPEIW